MKALEIAEAGVAAAAKAARSAEAELVAKTVAAVAEIVEVVEAGSGVDGAEDELVVSATLKWLPALRPLCGTEIQPAFDWIEWAGQRGFSPMM